MLLFTASASGLIECFSYDVNQHRGEIGYGVDGRYCCWHIPWHSGKIEETAVVVLRQLLKCGYTAFTQAAAADGVDGDVVFCGHDSRFVQRGVSSAG